jgi:hypothetical protein
MRRARAAVSILVVTAAALGLTIAPALSAPTGYTSDTDNIHTMDLGTGVVGPSLGPSGIPPAEAITDVALSPAGVLYGVSDGGTNPLLYTFDTVTGAATAVGTNLGASASNAGLTFTADGRLWMVSGASLFGIDTGTGVATLRGSAAGNMTGLAGGCNGVLYAVRVFGDPVVNRLIRIENLDGVPTFTDVGTDIGVTVVNSPKIAFDAAGTLWGRMSLVDPQTFTIDTTTGVGTFVADSSNATGLTITAASCPVPSTPSSDPASAVDGGPRFVG